MRLVTLPLRVLLGLSLLALGATTLVRAQPVAFGAEFQVNTYTTEEQFFPSTAVDGAGNFVIVWTSGPSLYTGTFPRPGQDGSEMGVFGQRYDNAGSPLGAEFQVNTYTTGYQLAPDIASDLGGDLIVVWESAGQNQPAPVSSIFGRRYDSSGAAIGGEFQVNTSTTFSRSRPAVASDPDGDFVVAWEGSIQEIWARRFNSAGMPIGGEFQVNMVTSGINSAPDVAVNSAGQFVVSWSHLTYVGPGAAVARPVARRFDGTGPLGNEFQVSVYTDPIAIDSAVAMDASGDFVVVWNNTAASGTGPSPAMLGRRFDAAGMPLGPDFVVDSQGGNLYSRVGVAMDATSTFIVAWETLDTSDLGVAVRQYDSSGAPTGGQLQVNTYATGYQVWPAIGAAPSGDFIVAWTTSTLFQPMENSPDGSLSGVFARQFLAEGTPAPLAASVRITPRRLNAKSNGRWINLKVGLPAGFNVGDVDPTSVGITNLDGTGCPGPYAQPIDPGFGIRPGGGPAKKFTSKLDRRMLVDAACLGDVEITIEGDFLTGEHFAGSDVIEIFRPGRGGSAPGGGNGGGNGNGGGHGNGGGNGHGNSGGNGNGHGR